MVKILATLVGLTVIIKLLPVHERGFVIFWGVLGVVLYQLIKGSSHIKSSIKYPITCELPMLQFIMTTLIVWSSALLYLLMLSRTAPAYFDQVVQLYVLLLVASIVLRSTVGLLCSGLLGVLFVLVERYMDGFSVFSGSFISVPFGPLHILVALGVAFLFTSLLKSTSQSLGSILGAAVVVGALCGLVMVVGLFGPAGIVLLVVIIPAIMASSVGVMMGLIGGLVYRMYSVHPEAARIKPLSTILIVGLFLLGCFYFFPYLYPELSDPTYDNTYGTKVIRAKALQIEQKLHDFVVAEDRFKVKSVNDLIPEGEWDKICIMEAYSSFDHLGADAQFRDERVKRKWAHNDEHQYTTFIINKGEIIPLRVGMSLKWPHPTADCLDKSQPFTLIYGSMYFEFKPPVT